MNPLGFDHFGALFGVVGALAAIAFAADTQPSPPEPVEVRYSPPSHPALLATTFVDWDSLVPRYTPVGRSMSVFDNPTPALDKFEVHITTLRPGMLSHAVHHHPGEEVVLIKEGSVKFRSTAKNTRPGRGF